MIFLYEVSYYLRLISFIFILFFLGGIVYYSIKLKIIPSKIECLRNWLGINPFIARASKNKKQWREIENLLKEDFSSSWKLAVIKAESLVISFLNQLGYQGKEFHDLLKELKLRGYQHLELLEGIHRVCEEIINSREYNLSQREAENIIVIYKKLWRELTEKFF